MNNHATSPRRLHSLDALRGVAALAVVFWHWQHFFFSGTALAAGFNKEAQPFYEVFKIFYQHGALGVYLFFSLSGFIFFWLYATTISTRRLTPSEFFVLRFSRLYPLHLVTLLLVAIGQTVYAGINGGSFVYAHNDVRHFALNILLAPSIGLERGYSYNGPVWSVSVEVVLYAVFFMFCRFRISRTSFLLVVSLAGLFVLQNYYAPLGSGIGSFFLGGVVHAIFLGIASRRNSHLITRWVVAATVVLWGATIASVYTGISLPLSSIQRYFPVLILFPMTILALALVEQGGASFAKALSPLGEISYSLYLIHFPLQLAFVLTMQAVGLRVNFFNTGISLILYFAVLLPLSFASFRYLEIPAQRYLRGKWLTPRFSRPPTAATEL
jgi:peptidoglycan/LPS O-acetylase OafA/YrhL